MQAVNYINHLANNETAKAIRLINDLVDSGIDLKSFVADILQILRKIIIEKVNPGLSQSLGLDFGESIEKEVLNLNTKLDIETSSWYIDKFILVNASLKTAQIKQLPLELVTVRLSQVKKANNYDDSDNTKTELKAQKSYIDTPKKTDAFDNNYVAKKRRI